MENAENANVDNTTSSDNTSNQYAALRSSTQIKALIKLCLFMVVFTSVVLIQV